MNITAIRINLSESHKNSLLAFCSIVFDNALVVYDVKVVKKSQGLVVNMPTEKIGRHCVVCQEKNPIQANFCNKCGTRLIRCEADKDLANNSELYREVAHPVNDKLTKLIQKKVFEAYSSALKNPPIKVKEKVPIDINEAGFPKFS